MLKAKIDVLIGEREDEIFPDFYSLTNDEMLNHRYQLRVAFKCPQNMCISDVFSKMVGESNLIQDINAKNDEINFSDLLVSQGIDLRKEIYIDWYRFDDIDRMELSLFTRYFEDIWYPGADDIYIYDDSFSWFILVAHYGAITIVHGHE